ncbi:hypothetical protein HY734_03665 [Candidatus Uhrbacteria bacterium]|nr:hypothetical protein [Candidatus Uhrbacteria bacterium]
MTNKARKLAETLKKTRADIQASVQRVFGRVAEDLETAYLEVSGELAARVDDLKSRAELTKEKYGETVAQIVDDFSKLRGWSKNRLQS